MGGEYSKFPHNGALPQTPIARHEGRKANLIGFLVNSVESKKGCQLLILTRCACSGTVDSPLVLINYAAIPGSIVFALFGSCKKWTFDTTIVWWYLIRLVSSSIDVETWRRP